MGNACSREAFGLDPCSDKLDLAAGRSGVISDKNTPNPKILGSNIYRDYHGSYCR